MTTEASTEQARATRIAVQLLSEHGSPETWEDAVDLLAVAYLKGGLDTRLEINAELRSVLVDSRVPLTDSVAAHILRDMEGTPLS